MTTPDIRLFLGHFFISSASMLSELHFANNTNTNVLVLRFTAGFKRLFSLLVLW